jgi:hypothetical protein
LGRRLAFVHAGLPEKTNPTSTAADRSVRPTRSATLFEHEALTQFCQR